MSDYISFFIVGIIYIAIVYVLVHPKSTGPQVIETVLGTFSDLVRGVAGQTYNASTNTWSTGNG
jgi:hypothetical protein